MTGHRSLLHQSQSSCPSYPIAHVKIKTDGMLFKSEHNGMLRGPASKLDVRGKIQNNLSRLECGLSSSKRNNQHLESRIHMYEHRFIYRAAVRVQKAEGSAHRQLDESEEL